MLKLQSSRIDRIDVLARLVIVWANEQHVLFLKQDPDLDPADPNPIHKLVNLLPLGHFLHSKEAKQLIHGTE